MAELASGRNGLPNFMSNAKCPTLKSNLMFSIQMYNNKFQIKKTTDGLAVMGIGWCHRRPSFVTPVPKDLVPSSGLYRYCTQAEQTKHLMVLHGKSCGCPLNQLAPQEKQPYSEVTLAQHSCSCMNSNHSTIRLFFLDVFCISVLCP